MSNQSLRQASIRAITGTTGTYEGDWHALFDDDGIAAGPYNQRLLAWINARLSVTYTNLNDAKAAFAAAESVGSFNELGTFSAGTPSWIVAGSSVDLDFVNQRYWWNNSVRTSSAFLIFSGGTFSDGLVLDGVAANHDIRITWTDFGITTPCSLHASFIPASVAGTMYAAELDNTNNNVAIVGTSVTSAQNIVTTGGVAQAAINSGALASAGVRITVGGQFETNNILQSVNGATGGTADTSATIFTPSVLRIGERPSGAQPFNGTLRRVTLFTGTKNQTQLNAESALVHAT